VDRGEPDAVTGSGGGFRGGAGGFGAGDRFAGVRGVEIEVDAAEGSFIAVLAEDHGEVTIEGDAVPEVGAAVEVGLDGLFDEGTEDGGAVFRTLFEANDVAVVTGEGRAQLRLECFHGDLHGREITGCGEGVKPVRCQRVGGVARVLE